MRLSVLITTSRKTKKNLDLLLGLLMPQFKDIEDYEVYIEGNEVMQLGAKYNELLKDAVGDYVWILNDTDIISETAIQDILTAIEQGPVIIGINGANNTTDHVTDWSAGRDNISVHCPMRLDAARKFPFRNKSIKAEEIWKKKMAAWVGGGLKEVKIHKPIIQKRIALKLVK